MARGFDSRARVPAGGVGMLNAIGGPLPDVSFCPTGGISIESAPAFLACKRQHVFPSLLLCRQFSVRDDHARHWFMHEMVLLWQFAHR